MTKAQSGGVVDPLQTTFMLCMLTVSATHTGKRFGKYSNSGHVVTSDTWCVSGLDEAHLM